MNPKEAAALIDEDNLRRMKAVQEAMTAACQEHMCDVIAVPQILPDGRISAVVQIIAK